MLNSKCLVLLTLTVLLTLLCTD